MSDTQLQEAIETNKKVYRPKPDEEERGGKRKWREEQAERRKRRHGPVRIYRFHDKTEECEGIFQVRGDEEPTVCLGCKKPNLRAVSEAV